MRTAASSIPAGLCHGAAGLVHLLDRLWQATGEPLFAEAASAWGEHTIRFRGVEGIGGYQAWEGDYFESSADDLAGTTGIGLALAATISTRLPDWDRPLLVSVSPRGGA